MGRPRVLRAALAAALALTPAAARAGDVPALARAYGRCPRLFDAEIAATVTVAAEPLDGETGTLASAAAFDVSAKTLTVEPVALAALEGRFPAGILRPGGAAESAVVHELLRALAAALDGADRHYARDVGAGRFAEFRKAVAYGPARSALEARALRVSAARLRLEIDKTELTRKAYLSGARGMLLARMSVEYDAAEALTLEQARAYLTAIEEERLAAARGVEGELGRLRREEREEVAELAAKFKVPVGRPWDPESPGSEADWFARSGQIALYGAKPGDYLTPAETLYWAKVETYLARKGPFPTSGR